jgi:hypothetical protein
VEEIERQEAGGENEEGEESEGVKKVWVCLMEEKYE